MKLTKTILSAAALLAVALVINVPVFAEQAVRAEIPFAFDAGGKHFEAGVYTVQNGPSYGIVMLTAADGHRILMSSSPGSVGRALALEFAKNGNGRLLTTVRLQPDSAAYVVGKKAGQAARIEIASR